MLLELYSDKIDLQVRPETTTFWYDETIYGASTFHLHIVSNDWRKWDALVTNEQRLSAKLRWGFLDGTAEEWSTWKTVLLTLARSRYAFGSVEVWIDGVDAGYRLTEVAHGMSFVDMRVSDMVKVLADANGLKSRISETRSQFSLYQGQYSDAGFITNVLLRHAVSNSGRADYCFYIEDGETVVFEPVDLTRVYTTYRVRTSASSPRVGDIVVLDVSQQRLFRATESSYSTEMRGFDSFKKEPVHRTINEDSAGFSYTAKYRPTAPSAPSTIEATPHGEVDLVTAEGKASWSQNARQLFRAEAALPYPDIRTLPGRVVELAVHSPLGPVHWTAGRWVVWKVRQWLRPSGFGTLLFLERRSYE